MITKSLGKKQIAKNYDLLQRLRTMGPSLLKAPVETKWSDLVGTGIMVNTIREHKVPNASMKGNRK